MRAIIALMEAAAKDALALPILPAPELSADDFDVQLERQLVRSRRLDQITMAAYEVRAICDPGDDTGRVQAVLHSLRDDLIIQQLERQI